MTPDHLLPANATPLEQALSRATDAHTRLALPVDAIRQFKTDPADALLPWLIWEYGLGELLPYLPDPRRAIASGILWQRLRGTPAALSTALAWIGMSATLEQEPPGVHFASFQLDPGRVLDDDTEIAHLISIARLSAPARARLSRIYHGHDLRRAVLSESRLGQALLSDHSGVFWRDGLTKLSFGRSFTQAAQASGQALEPSREAVRYAVARLLDRTLLSFSALGDPGHTPNALFVHSRLRALANALGVPDPIGMRPERRFARAQVLLSDSTPLGDINANLPRFVWQEAGHPIALGAGDPLSATPHRLRRVEVLERLALGMWHLGESVPSRDAGALVRQHSPSNAPLPDAAGWRPRLYQRAQVRLSESVLGALNSRTPRRALVRTRPMPRLGELALGDAAEVEWQALTEMHSAVSVWSAAEPFEFVAALAVLQRLLAHSTEANTSAQAAPSRTALSSKHAAWSGQTWTGVRWPSSSWTDTRELIGAGHSQG